MRDRRVFLIGDAAHVFFPAGGYGLNSAIEDAFSLAWRIKLVWEKKF
ncbi:MAG TPA: FAD-dependent monooxygenase [Candidatus Rhabdochlamydia sp.]|jgi:2-polyprenyl-6-methoxyphenol hydroxylase-like FAD-dependent oxidoreductase|nr:FAD-dependent monooxygenase [Candidatus Rhabdochlamydia sp.]